MLDYSSSTVENSLVLIGNELLDNDNTHLYTDEYYKLNFSMWEIDKLSVILKTFKFKTVGNASEYPELFPMPDSINDTEVFNDITKTNIISVSTKLNAVMIHSIQKYNIRILLLIDKNNYKKFNKKFLSIMEHGRSSGIFTNVDFSVKPKEYIEISAPINEDDRYISVEKKKVIKETLVYDTSSEIFNVMQDIKLFFKDDTKKLYEKMNIQYKRGIILHGEPGNGKTAMVRELIRQLTDITVIIINSNTPRIIFVLSELINALDNRKVMIVIEDLDAVIRASNRSEFLNLLDGVNMKSGVYFLGTTNYPERIDPAFVNRAGRFDRSYKIPNPNEAMRRAFFRSCKLQDILENYTVHKENSENKDLNIIDLFVKYSDNLSMANLKELMVSTQYTLIQNKNISIEEALETNYKVITTVKEEHDKSYDNYSSRMKTRYHRDEDFDEYEEE